MASREEPIDVERISRLTEIPIDEVYRLLADDRTRTTIRVLSESDHIDTLDELTDAITCREDEIDDGYDAVRLALAHIVLPKLEAYGLLTYHAGESQVTVEQSTVQVDDVLAKAMAPMSQSQS